MTQPQIGDEVFSLLLTCLDGEECTVAFEPWGNAHVLRRGDWFRVDVAGARPGEVEVSWTRDAILVGLRTDAANVSIHNRAGHELSL